MNKHKELTMKNTFYYLFAAIVLLCQCGKDDTSSPANFIEAKQVVYPINHALVKDYGSGNFKVFLSDGEMVYQRFDSTVNSQGKAVVSYYLVSPENTLAEGTYSLDSTAIKQIRSFTSNYTLNIDSATTAKFTVTTSAISIKSADPDYEINMPLAFFNKVHEIKVYYKGPLNPVEE